MPRTKKCSQCGEIKPLSEFYQRKSGAKKGQHTTPCKSCKHENASKYARSPKGREAYKRKHLLNQYGIYLELPND